MEQVLLSQTSCIILSAGSSGRMGMHKALLKYDENTTFIEKITNEYIKAGIERVIVVVSRDLSEKLSEGKINFPEEVTIVINENPEFGRFYSLQTGAKQLNQQNFCFFQNVDNPFTPSELLLQLHSQKEEAEVIIPTVQNKAGHPVLISPVVMEQILKEKGSDVRIDLFLKKFEVKKIKTSDEKILININSMVEYLNAGFLM
jgi:molybdenum cofactor cytidylyltransferase